MARMVPLTPLERWRESGRLWEFYLAAGGTLDPEPDSQCPFDNLYPLRPEPADGRPGVLVYGGAEFSRDCDITVLSLN